jgi:hypothetical protein
LLEHSCFHANTRQKEKYMVVWEFALNEVCPAIVSEEALVKVTIGI